MASERKEYLLYSLVAGGIGVFIFLMTAFWVTLLLSNGPAFIPNYAERIAMFKSLRRHPRQGGSWIPRQGENWIF
jgi:hypothetical protein